MDKNIQQFTSLTINGLQRNPFIPSLASKIRKAVMRAARTGSRALNFALNHTVHGNNNGLGLQPPFLAQSTIFQQNISTVIFPALRPRLQHWHLPSNVPSG